MQTTSTLGHEIGHNPISEFLWKNRYNILLIGGFATGVLAVEQFLIPPVVAAEPGTPTFPVGPGVTQPDNIIHVPNLKSVTHEAVETQFRGKVVVEAPVTTDSVPEIVPTPKLKIVFEKVVTTNEKIPDIVLGYLKDEVKTPNIEISGAPSEQNTLIEGYVSSIELSRGEYYARYITFLDGEYRGMLVRLDRLDNSNTNRVYESSKIPELLANYKLDPSNQPSILRVHVGRDVDATKKLILEKSVKLNSIDDQALNAMNDTDIVIEATLTTTFKK